MVQRNGAAWPRRRPGGDEEGAVALSQAGRGGAGEGAAMRPGMAGGRREAVPESACPGATCPSRNETHGVRHGRVMSNERAYTVVVASDLMAEACGWVRVRAQV